MRNLSCSVLAFLLAILILPYHANAQSLQMGVSVDFVPVGSDFNGTDIVVFGSIEDVDTAQLLDHDYHVVVTVQGANEDVIIRKKDRTFGIWINRSSQAYSKIPSFYSVISDTPLSEIADVSVLKKNQVGIDNLLVKPQSQGDLAFLLEAGGYSDALRRVREGNGLFSEFDRKLDQLSPTLFRARVYLPPNVPIGQHAVIAHLFRDGEYIASKESSFGVRKVGFERWMYNFAHNNSFLYGLMAVLVAIATGWIANAIFRKK